MDDNARYYLHNLRAWREYKKFTQGDLAKASAVGRSTIYRIEARQSRADSMTIDLLCQALGINSEDLLSKRPDIG